MKESKKVTSRKLSAKELAMGEELNVGQLFIDDLHQKYHLLPVVVPCCCLASCYHEPVVLLDPWVMYRVLALVTVVAMLIVTMTVAQHSPCQFTIHDDGNMLQLDNTFSVDHHYDQWCPPMVQVWRREQSTPRSPFPSCLVQICYIVYLGSVAVVELLFYLVVLVTPSRQWLLNEINFNLLTAIIILGFVMASTCLQRARTSIHFAEFGLFTALVLFVHACALAYWINFQVWVPLFRGTAAATDGHDEAVNVGAIQRKSKSSKSRKCRKNVSR